MNDDMRRLTAPFLLDPHEPIGRVEPGGPVEEAEWTGEQFRHVYGTMLLHRPHDLWVAPADRGRHLQDLIRARLLAERFSDDDACEWAFRNWRWFFSDPFSRDRTASDDRLAAQVVEQALAYRDTGIPNDEAFEWVKRHKSADDAVWFRSHGWNPDAHRALVSACLPFAPHVEDSGAWVQSHIVWWRALRYLQAGLRLPEALEQENRRLDGEDVDAALDLLIALAEKHQP